MKARTLIGILLIGFACASVVVLAVQESRRANRPSASPETRPAAPIVIYYFHTERRCEDCLAIEHMTQQAVNETFAREIEDGRLAFRSVNWEQEDNFHLRETYELAFPTVVLTRPPAAGRETWRKLDRVWPLLHNRARFTAYIQDEVRRWLKESP